MKLQNHLITTIPEFVKYFNYSEFWLNRAQFVRDMSPSKVYYWEDGLKESYDNIKKWIETEAPAPAEVQKRGIESLEYILGSKIEMSDTQLSSSCVDFSKSIIRVEIGQNVVLPEYTGGASYPFSINIHKIEFFGPHKRKSELYIGNKHIGSYYGGDFVYVTELNEQCIEILPNHQLSDNNEMTLIGKEGEFFSTLLVRDIISGNTHEFNQVISFAAIGDGYIFIDSIGKPIYMMTNMSTAQFMLKHNESGALYVKAIDNVILILYRDGVLRSTTNIQQINNVYFANIRNKTIVYKQ